MARNLRHYEIYLFVLMGREFLARLSDQTNFTDQIYDDCSTKWQGFFGTPSRKALDPR